MDELTLLRLLAGALDRTDPPPAGLDDRVMFALEVDAVDTEMAWLEREVLTGSGARASEHSRTITFDSASLTVMISVVERADGRVRLDGWLAPPGPLRVELRVAARPDSAVHAGADGRFVFDNVPRGLAQLVVQPPSGPTVVTPALAL
ncbi:hypothetical protein [Dactylosporangium sp. NPDC050588]|uniref:hypothetical protein n=1 Tax=Dactylosporangium sp. NPDC050588 TaxID=3157211 RepID=UPI0033C45048